MANVTQFIKNNNLGNVSDTLVLQKLIDQIVTTRSSCIAVGPSAGVFSKNMETLNLGGRQFIIDQPIRIRKMHGAVIAGGAIVASDKFPEGEYLFDIQEANTLKIENVLFECKKRANGIFANKFLRLRIEDCTIMHQKDFGIYGNDVGYNHELEVIKCNIIEYLWGDGISPGTKDKLPNFRVAANRTSTGVYLGQADNVVSDCNINLCRVGIKVGMRANRIQGNHITAGGSSGNEIFDGIVLDKNIKSSCLIVNNYIDNCRVVMNVDDLPINARNYVTITDNLFYRGFNHPEEGPEFNHIIVRAMKPHSILQNVIIANNQFYTQDEHLDGLAERRITPIQVVPAWELNGINDSLRPLNPLAISGTVVQQNAFTNVNKYFENPMGSRATIVTELPDTPTDITKADFERYLVWGEIYSCNVTMISEDMDAEPVSFYAVCRGRVVSIKSERPVRVRYCISVSIDRPYHNHSVVID